MLKVMKEMTEMNARNEWNGTNGSQAVKPAGGGVLWKVLNLLALAFMLVLNGAANILPINGVGTGAVSDFYGNLFAPAGFTFAIWGLIYLLALAFGIWQFRTKETELLGRVSPWFVASSVANGLWILAWHFYHPLLALLLMLGILACLGRIAWLLQGRDLGRGDRLGLRLPFSVYFGWITVATVANVTAVLVDLERQGIVSSGILAPEVWTAGVLLAAGLVGLNGIFRLKDPAYGLVLAWSYLGILVKHLSSSGFAGAYPLAAWFAGGGLVVFLGASAWTAWRNRK